MFALASVGYIVVIGDLRRGNGNHTGVYPSQNSGMGRFVAGFRRDVIGFTCFRLVLFLLRMMRKNDTLEVPSSS